MAVTGKTAAVHPNLPAGSKGSTAAKSPLISPDNGSEDLHLARITLPVLGMTCASCQHHVESALKAAAGVHEARVDLMRHRAAVKYDSSLTGPEALVEAIRGSGYESAAPRGMDAGMLVPGMGGMDERHAGWKAGATIFAGAAAMLLGMPLGMAAGPESTLGSTLGWGDRALMAAAPWLFEIPHELLRWGLLNLTAVLAVWAGSSIYRSAWKALLHRETNMNTLVALGTGVAFGYSAFVTLWLDLGERQVGGAVYSNAVYFDSVLLILGFLLLGKWLEARARHRALAAVNALTQLQPATVRLRRADGEFVVPVSEAQVGDVAVILPGERVPVDGLIEGGRTTVDESMLTGEPVPLERGVGERVLAGSLNYDGAIVCRVESAGAETTLAEIGRLVEQAQSSRAPMERLADRASAIFVPVVLGLALMTLLGWLAATHSVSQAVLATVAVLVIACPCAMGLAVPAALTVAIGRGAQFGVLIKGGDALERVAGLQAVAMDKTGTLTVGKPTLVGIHAMNGFAEEELLRMAAAAEDHSAHPLAHAIVEDARSRGIRWEPAKSVQIVPGRGLEAAVVDPLDRGKTRSCLLGNQELMTERSIPFPAVSGDPSLAGVEDGVTRLWMAVDGKPAGWFDAKDTLRPTAAAAVRWLREHAIAVKMLTGDSASAAGPIARAAGVTDVAAALMPSDKVSRIRELQRPGRDGARLRVGMVGDGINDAAALAQADAGMAMGVGAALAQEAGDVLLLRSDPMSVCTAIALSRATLRVMRQNLAWAVGYNVAGIPLAAGLLYPAFHVSLTPWMAAAAMAFSSVSVLFNSLRLRGWKPPLASV